MSELAVDFNDVRKTYISGLRRKKVPALLGTSWQVSAGECVGIVGPNGAGKTTSLKILTGLVTADSGSVKIFGMSVEHREALRDVGYLPENPYFYEHLTPKEVLHLYGSLFGIAPNVLAERIPQLIERVGLTFAADRPLKKFSKGMRQRIGIAQALINDPKLVILDEPQSGLDPEGRRAVRDLIVELHDSGKTILLCSHILPDVQAVCDRVVALRSGVVRSVASLRDLRERVSEFEVLLAGGEKDVVGDVELTRKGDLWRTVMPDKGSVQELLRAAIEEGFEIYSVTPHVPDLEEILLDAEDPS